jgi:hypothetical protein
MYFRSETFKEAKYSKMELDHKWVNDSSVGAFLQLEFFVFANQDNE